MKLLFAPDGKILGAQIVGRKGVDKRIDVIATAMRDGVAAPALAELELAYAPPFNTAKDPVNLAGMIAGNVLDGTSRILHADAVPAGMFLLDVREVAEFENGTIPGAVNIPLGELRTRLGELDQSRPLAVFCRVGQRGYVAERILRQHGFDVYNLSGGYLTWQQFHAETPKPVRTVAAPEAPANDSGEAEVVDARALACPGPVVRLKQKVDVLEPGGAVKLLAPLSFAPDLAGWIQSSGNTLVSLEKKEEFLEAVIRKAGAGNVAAAAETPGRARLLDGAVQQRPRQGDGGADHRVRHGRLRCEGRYFLHLLGLERAAEKSGSRGRKDAGGETLRLDAAEGRPETFAFQNEYGRHGNRDDEARDGRAARDDAAGAAPAGSRTRCAFRRL